MKDDRLTRLEVANDDNMIKCKRSDEWNDVISKSEMNRYTTQQDTTKRCRLTGCRSSKWWCDWGVIKEANWNDVILIVWFKMNWQHTAQHNIWQETTDLRAVEKK